MDESWGPIREWLIRPARLCEKRRDSDAASRGRFRQADEARCAFQRDCGYRVEFPQHLYLSGGMASGPGGSRNLHGGLGHNRHCQPSRRACTRYGRDDVYRKIRSRRRPRAQPLAFSHNGRDGFVAVRHRRSGRDRPDPLDRRMVRPGSANDRGAFGHVNRASGCGALSHRHRGFTRNESDAA